MTMRMVVVRGWQCSTLPLQMVGSLSLAVDQCQPLAALGLAELGVSIDPPQTTHQSMHSTALSIRDLPNAGHDDGWCEPGG